jgi:alpha-tubulin suppressor-like RCC1 family protein
MNASNARSRVVRIVSLATLLLHLTLNSSAASAVTTNRAESSPAAQVTATATQMTAGDGHTCALTSAGSVQCWGSNEFGQLGNGTWAGSNAPVPVIGLSGPAIAISAEHWHTCALLQSGGIQCWGHNEWGQLGDTTTINRNTPVTVGSIGANVSRITTGLGHTCALLTDARVFCWGRNDSGQLGTGSTADESLPQQVVNLAEGAVRIASGAEHTCAALTSGGVKCWGRNEIGQLGDGTNTYRSTPVSVLGLTEVVIALGAGWDHTCVVVTGGNARCWGHNLFGQLGDNAFADSWIPRNVIGVSGASALEASGWHTCVLASGGVYCWGANFLGQLGDGTMLNRRVPVQLSYFAADVSAVSTGTEHTCVVLSTGRAACWGANYAGQLGIGSQADRQVPVESRGFDTQVSALSVGDDHNCALTRFGAALCWGKNEQAQLGDGTDINRQEPVLVNGLSSGVQMIAAGHRHSCALMTDGNVRCWGQNDSGQLGNGTVVNNAVPSQVMNLGGKAIALAVGNLHTCALLSTEDVRCWGRNDYGQLGDGTNTNRTTPVTPSNLLPGVTAISAGSEHTCALLTGGGVRCWGRNDSGQIGDNTLVNRSTPVSVVGLSSGVLRLTSGLLHNCVNLVGGDVRCWGDNTYGGLGDGTFFNRSTPVPVVGLSNGITDISAGIGHSCAVRNQTLLCWGWNSHSQLGDGTFVNRNTPTPVLGIPEGVSQSGGGVRHTCALTISGRVFCWGSNRTGQLGDGGAWHMTPQNVLGFSEPDPAPTGDEYENDDTCGKATFLSANIATQAHTFHRAGDEDWIQVEMVTGTNYTLVASDLTGGALPTFGLRTSCVTPPVATSPPTFGGEVRLPMRASDYPPGTYYIRIANTPPTAFGNSVSYQLSFRATNDAGAAIIVAGKNGGEIHQHVITQTTDLAYIVLLRNGFAKDRIYYLDNQTSRDVDGNGLPDDIDAPATVANVQNAIINWANDKVGPARPVWLFLADHGFPEQFLVSGDGDSNILTPTMLNDWLTQLETSTGVDQVNVLIDACNAGSFITPAGTISKPRRAILASTSDSRVAEGRPSGPGVVQRMYFSEALWSALDANLSLYHAFQRAKQAAFAATKGYQDAWLDDTGDGNPNGVTDGGNSSVRGLIGSVNTGGRPYLTWSSVDVKTGMLVVSAQSTGAASQVIVEVSKPGAIQSPIPGQVNLSQNDIVLLSDVGNGQWTGVYLHFTVPGVYQLVAYGRDADGSPAQPIETLVTVGGGGSPTITPTSTPTSTPIVTVSPTPQVTLQPRTYLPGVHR